MRYEAQYIYDVCIFVFENSLNVNKNLLKLAFRVFAASVKYFSLDQVFNEALIRKFLEDLNKIVASRIDVMKCFGEIFAIFLTIELNGEEVYYKYKNTIMQLFKSYIIEMMNITKGGDLSKEYEKMNVDKRFQYEDFVLQFALSLISFYRNNFSFIQEFDQITGNFMQDNEFTLAYMNEVHYGLLILTQCQRIPNDEIMKSATDFFQWFTFKISFLCEKNADPEIGIPNNYSIEQYINETVKSHFYNKFYTNILDKARQNLIEKMLRPCEVKIDIDETGEIFVESVVGTIYLSIHETMKDALIYLTHLDPITTQNTMVALLETQILDQNWNVNLLNSVCWSIGCISGALTENEEKKFIVSVIKYLLTLCDNKKGKTNKAAVASNIMYVVGQYYRFLNRHWKFLKTVVRKLFEFMHELHPGVQDFACETLMRISIKCGYQFVIIQEDEKEPYINVLARTMIENTKDLKMHQKLMFYEAIGNIISFDQNQNQQIYLIEQTMIDCLNQWSQIYQNSQMNVEFLLNGDVIKVLDQILKLNERISVSVKTNYFYYAKLFLKSVFDYYSYYTDTICTLYKEGNKNYQFIKMIKIIKKSILKFTMSLVNYTFNADLLIVELLPYLGVLIEKYKQSDIDNKDHEILKIFSDYMNQLKNMPYDKVELIWKFLCLDTLEMIQIDYNSFPEHRISFFELVKSLIINEFDAVFKIQDQNFNKNVINVIVWAFRHSQYNIAELGLDTLKFLLDGVNQARLNGHNISDFFYKEYFMQLLNEIFVVLTDSFHKASFQQHVIIIQTLIQVVDSGILTENLFSNEDNNKNFVYKYIVNINAQAFTHINKIQIESFALALFNKANDYNEIKGVIRDFLINLKSFSGSNEELFEEERKMQVEEAKKLEMLKRNLIPGMSSLYEQDIQNKFNIQNYQEN